MANYSQKSQSGQRNSGHSSIAVVVIIFLIKGYRYLASPWIGNQCRFYPSCSHYSEQAFGRFGFFRGCYLTVRRLLKCHPWHPGGEDHVPGATQSSDRHLSGRLRRKHSLN